MLTLEGTLWTFKQWWALEIWLRHAISVFLLNVLIWGTLTDTIHAAETPESPYFWKMSKSTDLSFYNDYLWEYHYIYILNFQEVTSIFILEIILHNYPLKWGELNHGFKCLSQYYGMAMIYIWRSCFF